MNYTIIGAGKSGRGFIGRLLADAGYSPTYIDSSLSMVQKLSSEKLFTIDFFGGSRPPMAIPVENIFHIDDNKGLEAIAKSNVVFVSVGAGNLPEVGSYLKKALMFKTNKQPILVITAENAIDPAKKLAKAIGTNNSSDFFVTEAAIFCSTIEKPDTAVDILSETYNRLPYDASKAKQFDNLPPFLVAEHDFSLLLTRKIFTYNCASAAIAYLGAYIGYEWYSDAANDSSVVRVLDSLYSKVNEVLCKVYSLDKKDQEAFAEASKTKFQNKEVRDSIERNARDATRKLGADERLIGPLLLMESEGMECKALFLVIASAIWYGLENEELVLQRAYDEGGISLILSTVSKLNPNDSSIQKIQEYFGLLQQRHTLNEILIQQGL